LYPVKRTTTADPLAYKYPYLLKNKVIERPGQAWAIDITYVPMKGGFMYLFAIIDLYSRYVVGWDLSNSMTAEWCCEVVREAIENMGAPELINSDQGSQFTSEIYTTLLQEKGIKISMDGKGRAIDNIFIERLWRTVKYEYIYLHVHENGLDLYQGLSEYFRFYNQERIHQSLQYETPEKVYKKVA
jgi:putative transposase